MVETYCVVEVAALVVASVGGEVGGVELAATMVSVVAAGLYEYPRLHDVLEPRVERLEGRYLIEVAAVDEPYLVGVS